MIARRPPTVEEARDLGLARDQAVADAVRDAERARWAGHALVALGALAGVVIGVSTGFEPWWAALVPLAGLGAPAGAAALTWRLSAGEARRAAEPYRLDLRDGLDELEVRVLRARILRGGSEDVWVLSTHLGDLVVQPARLGLAGTDPPAVLGVVRGPRSGWVRARAEGRVAAETLDALEAAVAVGLEGLGWLPDGGGERGAGAEGVLVRRLSAARDVWPAGGSR